ncbi:MAG: phosphatase PAP2 family protein, partial [Gemmatimonadota bacterium]|nr:phosphatase PAP2 family protein [Gemmatimonadota bacterium]
AVALTGAYVLAREGIGDPRLIVPVALALPATSGVGRMYLDRHWATDVAGGWLAGLSVAACCAALYELLDD